MFNEPEAMRKAEIQPHSQIDCSMADKFLTCLGRGGIFTFQTFNEVNKGDKTLSRVSHGDINQHYSSLAQRNNRGAGIFVMVNEGDCRGRKKENVKRVRAVFVDLDGAPLEPVSQASLKPHITLESSPGKYHAYWLVNGLSLDAFTTTQLALANRFDGDTSVKDLPRVMRLPGFFHRKNIPFQTRILTLEDLPAYDASDLLNAFNIDLTVGNQAFNSNGIIDRGSRNNAIFEMAHSLLAKGIPPEETLTRLLTANRERCTPPLSEDEIRDIWQRICDHRPANNALVAIINDPALKPLTHPARWLYVIAKARASNSSGPFSLTSKDCLEQGLSKRQRRQALRELSDAGLLVMVRQHRSGISTTQRLCALFTLGAKTTPKTDALGINLPPKSNLFRGQNVPSIDVSEAGVCVGGGGSFNQNHWEGK
jgi:hypothetical protein